MTVIFSPGLGQEGERSVIYIRIAVSGCAAGTAPKQQPRAPALLHSHRELISFSSVPPLPPQGFSREIQIILLQGFEPIESHEVMRLLEAGLLVLGGGKGVGWEVSFPTLNQFFGRGVYWFLCVGLSVESGWRVM